MLMLIISDLFIFFFGHSTVFLMFINSFILLSRFVLQFITFTYQLVTKKARRMCFSESFAANLDYYYAALGFYSCYNRPARVIQLSCPLANNKIAILAQGFFFITQLAVTRMLSQGTGGSVTSITASLAENPIAGLPASISMLTKGGLNAITASSPTCARSARLSFRLSSPAGLSRFRVLDAPPREPPWLRSKGGW